MGWCAQAPRPASASEAPISFRKRRRPTASSQCDAKRGNSRWRSSSKPSLSVNSSRLSQYSFPRERPSSSRMRLRSRRWLVEDIPSPRVHRWHVEQLVITPGLAIWYCFTSLRPSSIWFAGGCQSMLKTSSRALTKRSGARWHARHHSICSDATWYVIGIVSTGPWHVEQPTPLFTCMLWLKKTKSGRSCTLVHLMGFPVLKLSRIGAR